MLERNDALSIVFKNCNETFSANGFTVNVPENTDKGADPIFTDEDCAYIEITKNDLTVRLISRDDLLEISEKNGDGDFNRTEANLLDLENFTERDMKSLCNEINDTIVSSYGKKAQKAAQAKKAPVPVSKSAAKSGAMLYDANTLANRIVTLYPELKFAYTENYQKYGEFLGEDFFANHANKCIIGTIKSYDSMMMKKLFKILNDIYENGSSDTQDLVAVTILGELNNDPELLEKCRKEITDDDFYSTVAAVNKFLVSPAGKRAKKRLENPPKYKPKKKSSGMMSSLMNAGQPPMQ